MKTYFTLFLVMFEIQFTVGQILVREVNEFGLKGDVSSMIESKNGIPTRKLSFDEKGRLLAEYDYRSKTIILNYTYDENGFLIADSSFTYRNEYNIKGEILRVEATHNKSGEKQVYSFVYDSSGLLISSKGHPFYIYSPDDPKHKQPYVEQVSLADVKYTYDDNGRLLRKAVSDRGGKLYYYETYIYSSSGQIVQETYVHLHENERAPALAAPGYLTDKVVVMPGPTEKYIDTLKRIVKYEYQDDGRLKSKLEYNSMKRGWVKTQYTYDVIGNCIEEQRFDSWYDPQEDPLLSKEMNPFVTRYSFDNNLKVNESFYNQAGALTGWTDWTYDKNGKVVSSKRWTVVEGANFCVEEVLFDKNGNPIKRIVRDYWKKTEETYDYEISYNNR